MDKSSRKLSSVSGKRRAGPQDKRALCTPSSFLVVVAAVWVTVLVVFSAALFIQERSSVKLSDRAKELHQLEQSVNDLKDRLNDLATKQESHQKSSLRSSWKPSPAGRDAPAAPAKASTKQRAPEAASLESPSVVKEAEHPAEQEEEESQARDEQPAAPAAKVPDEPRLPPPAAAAAEEYDSDTSPVPLVDPTILTRTEHALEGDVRQYCAARDPDSQMLEHVKIWEGAKMGSPRILCLSYTLSSAHDTAVRNIQQTWGRRCDGYLAMSDKTDPSVPSVDIKHKGPEAYNNMWQKVRSIWLYVHRHHVHDFDYFVIGGDDLFVIVDNLRKYLGSDEIVKATEDGKKPIFLGRRFLPPNEEVVFNSGGAGYVINSAALQLLAEGLKGDKCRPNQEGFWEDVNTAYCLHLAGVDAFDTRDSQGRERFLPFTPGNHLLYRIPKEPDWFAKYTAKVGGLKDGVAGVSSDAVSFHYIKGDLMKRTYALLYGLCKEPPSSQLR